MFTLRHKKRPELQPLVANIGHVRVLEAKRVTVISSGLAQTAWCQEYAEQHSLSDQSHLGYRIDIIYGSTAITVLLCGEAVVEYAMFNTRNEYLVKLLPQYGWAMQYHMAYPLVTLRRDNAVQGVLDILSAIKQHASSSNESACLEIAALFTYGSWMVPERRQKIARRLLIGWSVYATRMFVTRSGE